MERTALFTFFTRDDNLALCPIFHFIALVLADHAFMAHGINSAEDIFRIEVPPHRNSLQLKWKPEKLNVPIFRRTMHTAQGLRISPDKALPYDTFNQYLQRLGRNAGFHDNL
jgi:uncharacterized protein DUF3435